MAGKFWTQQRWHLVQGRGQFSGQFNLHGEAGCFASIQQTFQHDDKNAPAALQAVVDTHNALLQCGFDPSGMRELHNTKAFVMLQKLFKLKHIEAADFAEFLEAILAVYQAAGVTKVE